MNIINNLFGNTPFFGRKGKIKENDRYELMHIHSHSHSTKTAGKDGKMFLYTWRH